MNELTVVRIPIEQEREREFRFQHVGRPLGVPFPIGPAPMLPMMPPPHTIDDPLWAKVWMAYDDALGQYNRCCDFSHKSFPWIVAISIVFAITMSVLSFSLHWN